MEAGRRCKNEEGWKRGKRNKFEGMRGMRVKVEKQKWRNVEWGGKKEVHGLLRHLQEQLIRVVVKEGG